MRTVDWAVMVLRDAHNIDMEMKLAQLSTEGERTGLLDGYNQIWKEVSTECVKVMKDGETVAQVRYLQILTRDYLDITAEKLSMERMMVSHV